MRIYWDPDKNRKLMLERGIDLEQVADIIYNEGYTDILQHPQKTGQKMFIVELNGYIHAVPFIIDPDSGICLKTAYPSRKYNRIYGGEKGEKA